MGTLIGASLLMLGMGPMYRQIGRKGLKRIENEGPRLAEVVQKLLGEFLDNASLEVDND